MLILSLYTVSSLTICLYKSRAFCVCLIAFFLSISVWSISYILLARVRGRTAFFDSNFFLLVLFFLWLAHLLQFLSWVIRLFEG